jgi:hypothetical protein
MYGCAHLRAKGGEVMNLSISILAPGHADGHATHWYWECISGSETQDCGSEQTADEAYEAAMIAYDITVSEGQEEHQEPRSEQQTAQDNGVNGIGRWL